MSMSRWWGPIFDAGRTTRARRWHGYALRSVFVLALLVGLILVWTIQNRRDEVVTVQEMAQMGGAAYSVLTLLELVAVLMIAPAATAGAICLDKTRGTLAHVFVTDLSDREIVLGKLAARLLPVLGLLACAVPVAAMVTLLGGIDPMALLGSFFIAAGLAVLGCSFALMLSVWASKTHEVIAVVFGVWALWLLACPAWHMIFRFGTRPIWLEWTNPFYLTNAPFNHPGETSLLEPILFALACGLIGVALTAVAVQKVRVVACRSARSQVRRVGLVGRGLVSFQDQIRWGKGPTLDANPVLWREWQRNQPSRWSKVVWGGFEVVSGLACVGLIIERFMAVPALEIRDGFGSVLGGLTTLGLLLVSVAAAAVLTEERTRGSLDVLLSTPVSTRTILWAKWWGMFRRVAWLAFWPVVVGVVSLNAGRLDAGRPMLVQVGMIFFVPILIITQIAAVLSLGLALATWIKRTGQATAGTIMVLVVSVVGWPIIGLFFPLTGWTRPQFHNNLSSTILGFGPLLGSPFVNILTAFTMSSLPNVGFDKDCRAFLIVIFIWTMFYGSTAWLLFEATVRTFDRCLGRMPERPSKPRLEPQTVSKPTLKGWGWRTPGAGGRRVGHAASFGPPPR